MYLHRLVATVGVVTMSWAVGSHSDDIM